MLHAAVLRGRASFAGCEVASLATDSVPTRNQRRAAILMVNTDAETHRSAAK